MENKVSIELKKILLDHNFKPIHQLSKVPKSKIEELAKIAQSENWSDDEMGKKLSEAAPPLYLGEKLVDMLAKIPAASNQEAADIYLWLARIKNSMVKPESILHVSKEELIKLKSILDKVKVDTINVVLNGQILQYLKTLEGQIADEEKKILEEAATSEKS